MTLRVGALISGGGTNLQAILDACENGEIPARVVFVGTDNPGAKGLARAEKKNIPTFVAEYGPHFRAFRENPGGLSGPPDFDLATVAARQNLVGKDPETARPFLVPRALAEAEIADRMEAFGFDLLVLAGFMRVLTPYFIDRINADPDRPRILNIHPALLPAFPGTDGYGDTFRYGCKVGGCTVHFVDYGEDTGPIVGQKAFAIEPGDDLDAVKKKGLAQEWELFPECIALFAENRLRVKVGPPDEKGRARRVVCILPPG